MRATIGQNIKTAVIQSWLKGKSRDEIAREHGLSTGTVSNIINGWRNDLGHAVVDDFRELAVALNKLHIDPSQAALGARVVMLMKSLGVDERDFQDFMSNSYQHSKEIGLQPENIACTLKEVLQLSESIPISIIPDYVEERMAVKGKLEKDIENLQAQESNAKARLREALEQERVTDANLNEFLNFRRGLQKYGIAMGDTSKFLMTLSTLNEMGSDPATIVSNYDKLREFEAKEITVDELNKEISQLKEQHESHSLAISTYYKLKSMGFGLNELKRLRRTLIEIADANEKPTDKAVAKFFSDIEEQYDEKLGFESKLENLKSQIREHQEAVNNQSSSFNEVWSTLARILGGGGEGQHGQLDAGDKLQEGHRAVGTTLQQAETKGSKATGHAGELQSETTNSNAAGTRTGTSSIKKNILGPEPLGNEAGKNADKKQPEQEELHLLGISQIKRSVSTKEVEGETERTY